LGYAVALYISVAYGFCVAPMSFTCGYGETPHCASGLREFNLAINACVLDDLFVPPIIGIAFSAVYALLRERKTDSRPEAKRPSPV
jgi:hypothetical protein